MRFTPLLVLSAMAAAAPAAFASSTTDITVSGTIVPAACTPSVSGGGSFDFGTIEAKSLEQDSSTRILSSAKQLSVVCDAPARFALHGIDGQAGSSIGMNVDSYGLGYNGSEKIGQYHIRTPRSTYVADGNTSIQSVRSDDDGTTWRSKDDDDADEFGPAGWIAHSGILTGYTNGDRFSPPTPIVSFSTDLHIEMRIAPARDLTLTDEIPINGFATIEVRYL